MKSLKGIIPIVNTIFQANGSIDLDGQRSLVRHLLKQGVHALALFGNAAEGYTLSGKERSLLTTMILKEVDGAVPVIVSSGHSGTDQAVALSREAEDAGAAALMVLPPHYLKPDAQGVFEYFEAISRAVSIPIMVQDAPLMTQVNIAPALLARMGRELEHVRYAKIEAPPTATKISDVLAHAQEHITVFGGLNGNFFIEELDRGAVGTMPGSDLCAGFVRMWDLYQEGERTAARRIFQCYLPLIRYELQPGLGVSAMKNNLMRQGIIECARVRHPTRTLDGIAQRELAELWSEVNAC